MIEESPTAPERSIAHTPRWLLAMVVLLLVALLWTATSAARLDRGDSRVTFSAQEEIDERREALRQSPENPIAQVELAYAYQQAGRFAEALELYEGVLAQRPTETAALYGKGSILLELGDTESAERVLWEVLKANSGHLLAAKALGELYAQRGHYWSLVRAVRPAVELNESSADLQFLMGLAYENLGNSEWAEARYRLALENYPDMPQARAGLERLGLAP